MKSKLIIDSISGRRLSAVLETPDTAEPGEPDRAESGVVVFAHCFTCGKDLRGAREISRAVVERGSGEVTIAGRSFTITREFIEALEGSAMHYAISSLGRPLLIFHSPVDTMVGIENAATIFHHARHPKSFVSLDTADHLLTRRDDARYVGEVLAAWARRYTE